MEDLERLQELANVVKNCSLCGLGKTATNPVMSTLKYFKDEYIAHVQDKKCPAGVCRSLCTMWIDPEKCIGCTKCARNCPVGAITGELKKLATKYPGLIKEVRGKGLMLGAELTRDDIGRDIVNDVLANGAIINCTAGNVLRFVPPLIITEADIDAVLACVDKALAKFA